MIDRIVSELRRPIPVHGEAVARAKQSVRRAGRRDPRRLRDLTIGIGSRPAFVVAAVVAAVIAIAALASFWPTGGGGAGDVAIGPVARNVQFVYVAGDASRVSLVGDFNDWDASATPLQASAGGVVWSVTIPLAPGPYRYAFVIDGEKWEADQAAPRAPADEFGMPSSLIVVEGSAT